MRNGGGADPARRHGAGVRLRHGTADRGDSAPVQEPDGDGFLRQYAEAGGEKAEKYGNVRFAQADITKLDYPDGSFDAVVAANVIHLLDEPYRALAELDRVCKPGGRLIIPTYMNRTDRGTTNSVSGAIGKAGADFKREFTPETYRRFFAAAGYTDARYTLCRGRIPCAVAVLQKNGG